MATCWRLWALLLLFKCCLLSIAVSQNNETDCQQVLVKLLRDEVPVVSGVYQLRDTMGAQYSAYCDMETNGGGWTLVMKVDGTKPTFAHSSSQWIDSSPMNPTSSDLQATEAKLASYANVPFTQMRLIFMKQETAIGGTTLLLNTPRSLVAEFQPRVTSLVSAISSGSYTPFHNPPTRNDWLNMVDPPSAASLQINCLLQGINTQTNTIQVRLGIIANDLNSCNNPDSFIGFGSNNPSLFCGNYARWSAMGDADLPMFGWIFIRDQPFSLVEIKQPYLYIGQSNVHVIWHLPRNAGNVKIELIRDGSPGMVDTIVDDYGGTSPFVWANVNVSDARRTDYRFRFSSVLYPEINSSSSAIVIDTAQKMIVSVNTPPSYLYNGQQNVQISWISTGYLGNIVIELLRDDDSTTIDIIATNHSGSSSFTWENVNVSDARRTDYRFRVQSTSYPFVIPAISDRFEIDTAFKGIWSINIPNPYLYMDQKNVKISWTSTGYVGDLMFELLRDDGDPNNVDILESNFTGVSPFTWNSVNVTDAPRPDYNIRITSISYFNISCNSSLFEVDLFQSLHCPALFRVQTNESTATPHSHFGHSISMDNGRVIIGSAKAVHVLEFDLAHSEWQPQSSLRPPDPANQQFGNITRIKDDVIVVNGISDSSEVVFVFRFNASKSQWFLEDTLEKSTITSGFGDSIAIGEGWIIVGASRSTIDEQPNVGLVLPYHWNESSHSWQLEQMLTATDPAPNARFGFPSISLFGNQLVVGCSNCDNQRGAVYVFTIDDDIGQPTTKIQASDGTSGDRFGHSITFTKDMVVIGAPGRDGDRGYVYQFGLNISSGEWKEHHIKIAASDGQPGDNFGETISSDGGVLVVGASGKNGSNGCIYLFEFNFERNRLYEIAQFQPPNSDNGPQFGSTLDINGDWIIVGAPFTNIDMQQDAGAVFFFEFEARGDQVIIGEVRDGDEEGKQLIYQSSTNEVLANWDSFVVVLAFDGVERNITTYNITTMEEETDRVLLQTRQLSFPKPRPVFSFNLTTDSPLQHNKTYVTTIEASACSCCGIAESVSSIGFLVDTTPPEIASVVLDTILLDVNGTLAVRWNDISDPESHIDHIRITIIDSDTNEPLPQQCGVLDGFPEFTNLPSSGQLNLTWMECGTLLPPATPLKFAITAANGAGLLTTMLSNISFQMAGVRITNVIGYDPTNSQALKVCRKATVRWTSIGITSDAFVMISLVQSSIASADAIVVNITHDPVPVGLGQIQWEPIPSSIAAGQYRVFSFLQQPNIFNVRSASKNIQIDPADICLEITSPNKTSRWMAGTTQQIEWEVSGSATSQQIIIMLDLLTPNGLERLGSPDASAGYSKWSIRADQTSNDTYRIRATSNDDSAIGVIFLTAPFEIVAGTNDTMPDGIPTSLLIIFLSGLMLMCCVVVIIIIIIMIVGGIAIGALYLLQKKKKQQHDNFHQQLQSLSQAKTSSSKMHIEYNTPEIKHKDLTFIAKLGKGSYGTVFKAVYQKSHVAVKMLDLESDGLEEFLKETTAMIQLQHPRLLQFVGIINDEGKFGIVTEFMDRGSLDHLLWRRARDDTSARLSWSVKMGILNDVASGMVFIHSRGFIHRDLKSPNILIGEANRAKIGDFGLARTQDKSVSTMTDKQGTPLWMAPEVIETTGHYENKCDVYSFGIIMWEMLAEKEPYYDVKNKQSVMFNVARDPNFRPAIPSWDTILKIHSTDEEKKMLDAIREQFTSLMGDCWSHDPALRPSFEQVVEHLNAMAPRMF